MADQPKLSPLSLIEMQNAKLLIEEAASLIGVCEPTLAHALRNIVQVLEGKTQRFADFIESSRCASCMHYDDLISEHCEGPALCPYACPHVEPGRSRELQLREATAEGREKAKPRPR